MMAAPNRPTAATVKLHRGLYMQEAIKDAATAFADFASFAVRCDGEHFVVDIGDLDGDVEGDVVAEFCNFALANTAIRTKSGEA